MEKSSVSVNRARRENRAEKKEGAMVTLAGTVTWEVVCGIAMALAAPPSRIEPQFQDSLVYLDQRGFSGRCFAVAEFSAVADLIRDETGSWCGFAKDGSRNFQWNSSSGAGTAAAAKIRDGLWHLEFFGLEGSLGWRLVRDALMAGASEFV